MPKSKPPIHFGINPFRMRRAGGGGMVVIRDEQGTHWLEYQEMSGAEVTHRHATRISKTLFKALREEARKNYEKMKVICDERDEGVLHA